jgi:hypothetical protein
MTEWAEIVVFYGLACYAASCALCQRSEIIRQLDWRVLAGTLLVLNALDLLTTKAAFAMGAQEANAIINEFVLPLGNYALIIYKLIFSAPLLALGWFAGKSLRAKRVAIALIIALTFVVLWNTFVVFTAKF